MHICIALTDKTEFMVNFLKKKMHTWLPYGTYVNQQGHVAQLVVRLIEKPEVMGLIVHPATYFYGN